MTWFKWLAGTCFSKFIIVPLWQSMLKAWPTSRKVNIQSFLSSMAIFILCTIRKTFSTLKCPLWKRNCLWGNHSCVSGSGIISLFRSILCLGTMLCNLQKLWLIWQSQCSTIESFVHYIEWRYFQKHLFFEISCH